MNAWITPGIQANSVSKILIKNALPIPCFKKTARGGSRIFKIIVSNDILIFFWNLDKCKLMYFQMKNTLVGLANF